MAYVAADKFNAEKKQDSMVVNTGVAEFTGLEASFPALHGSSPCARKILLDEALRSAQSASLAALTAISGMYGERGTYARDVSPFFTFDPVTYGGTPELPPTWFEDMSEVVKDMHKTYVVPWYDLASVAAGGIQQEV